ncbi:Aste57867_21431 [Aphanomyces stellatus]|uniref:Aste57867_21431 protein n=1 Tax=Aphanomyces stellatus TaxID=120398 RepID=A0A485LHG0_9STRA|nr:hypothetical protein As57867_021362 [Aphanomyces stellatus]VFT98102.1 Aste57867_21431 [Aphanomyces stellatus]
MQDLLADEENQSRRTFCQMPFTSIYENAEKGQQSVAHLLAFLGKKNAAERKYAESMLGALADGELSDFEEYGTSVKGVLSQWQLYLQSMNNQQMVWAQVVEEHVARPLESLKDASTSYIQTLQAELTRANDEYAHAEALQKKAKAATDAAKLELMEAQSRQHDALHEIGVPSFELQRLASRVHRCGLELTRALAEKEQTKQLLLKKIVARDEMSMAVSVAYQRAEEERMDQMATCMKLWMHVEKEHLKFREKQLAHLEEHVVRMDRAGDMQLLIHNRREVDNMHFQGKALSLLDWQRQQDHHAVAMAAMSIKKETTSSEDDMLLVSPTSQASSSTSDASRSASSLQDQMDALVAIHFDEIETDDETNQSAVDVSNDHVAALCDDPDGRLGFVRALNRQRSADTKVRSAAKFDSLVRSFHVFFDACVRHDDTKAAKTAMMLSATFYMIPRHNQDADQRHGRRYVQEDVKDHTIWRNPKFWEKALLLAIGEELHKSPQRCPWEDLPTNVPRSDGVFSREEAVSHVHNIVFGQLGSFTLSMLEFDVPITQIRYFIETMCDAHELTEEQRFLLRANLREIAIKLGYHERSKS